MPGWIPPQPGQSGTPGEHLTVAEEVVKRMAMAGGDAGQVIDEIWREEVIGSVGRSIQLNGCGSARRAIC